MPTALCGSSHLLPKHQPLMCCRHKSDDSTTKNGDGGSDSKKDHSLSSDDLVDFDEMLENIRKLKLEGESSVKDVYIGKKKHQVKLEERRTVFMTIEELVDFLTELNGIDICVINVDPDLNYVKYLVTVTGSSTRHLLSMAKSLAYEVRFVDSCCYL